MHYSVENLQICDGNLVTRTFFPPFPFRRRLVLCLDGDEAGLCVHSTDSVAPREWLHRSLALNPTLMDINAISAVAAVGEEEPEMNSSVSIMDIAK